jgi:serine protease Do
MAKPAVVNVTTKMAQSERSERNLPNLEEFFRRGLPPGGRAPSQGRGSGFVISKDGHILTNNHVVDDAASVQVKLSDGREFTAKVVGKDAKTDLALIKIDAPADLPVLPLGDSAALQVGEPVMAIGNPFGLEQTVTTGIVSATGRLIGSGPYDDFIQTDASVNPGNSGGPLINARGEAVGINSAIFSRSGGSIGIGFAVPINMAKFVVPQLAQHGRVVRGWLGVSIQPMTTELAKSFGVAQSDGALVANVLEDSPAAKAGVKAGDIIVDFDGHKIGRTTDLTRIVAATPIGKDVRVSVLRDGKPMALTARIEKMDDKDVVAAADSGDATTRPRLGVTVEPMTPELARQLGVTDGRGVVVREVKEGSPAADAGVRAGDVITEINRKPIKSVEDLRKALEAQKAGTTALLLIHRDGGARYVTVKV